MKITRGGEAGGAQRARNSLCTRKCIKGENVIYRVHAQNSHERRSCVREERDEREGGGWEVGRVVLRRCGSIAGDEGRVRSAEFRVAGFPRTAIQFAMKRTISPININNAR